jgi:hypothetical protein
MTLQGDIVQQLPTYVVIMQARLQAMGRLNRSGAALT